MLLEKLRTYIVIGPWSPVLKKLGFGAYATFMVVRKQRTLCHVTLTRTRFHCQRRSESDKHGVTQIGFLRNFSTTIGE
jgi:hypothetical protein